MVYERRARVGTVVVRDVTPQADGRVESSSLVGETRLAIAAGRMLRSDLEDDQGTCFR